MTVQSSKMGLKILLKNANHDVIMLEELSSFPPHLLPDLISSLYHACWTVTSSHLSFQQTYVPPEENHLLLQHPSGTKV